MMTSMAACVVAALASSSAVTAAYASRPFAFLVVKRHHYNLRKIAIIDESASLPRAASPTHPQIRRITRSVVNTVRGGGAGDSETKTAPSIAVRTTNERNVTTATGDDNDATTTIPPLRYLGDKNLMQIQPLVTQEEMEDPSFSSQLQMLRKAMKKYGGIGIAGPQVGWWTRVFIFGIEGGVNPRYPQAGEIPLSFWINPEITWSSEDTNWMWEGCLSVPAMRGWVERPASVIMRGMDENGQECEKRLDGLPARVAQHELDHLDGTLFPKRVPGAEYLVPQASMDAREGWGDNWPSPGSRRTGLGELCDDK